MYYSPTGSSWTQFWSRDDLVGWSRYSDNATINDTFRYVSAGVDSCSVDWSYIAVRSVNGTFVPEANFTASPRTGYAPLTVRFTDNSTGLPKVLNWSFGDGNFSADLNPEYTYLQPGSYSVALTVSNESLNDTRTLPDYISVADPATAPRYRHFLNHVIDLTPGGTLSGVRSPVMAVDDLDSDGSNELITGLGEMNGNDIVTVSRFSGGSYDQIWNFSVTDPGSDCNTNRRCR